MGNAKIDDSDSTDARQCSARELDAKQFSGLELDAFGRGFADWCDAAVFRAALPSGCCVATIGSTTTRQVRRLATKLSHNERTKADWPLTRGAVFLLFIISHR